MNKLLLVSGLAYSGKDTFADYICALAEQNGWPVFRYGFGEPIKEFGEAHFGYPSSRPKDVKGRRFLQLLGTDVGRCYDNLTWYKQWVERVRASVVKANKGLLVIAPDFRHEHEIEAGKMCAFGLPVFSDTVHVQITAPTGLRQKRAEAKGEKLPEAHASEGYLMHKPSFVFDNDAERTSAFCESVAVHPLWGDLYERVNPEVGHG